MRRLLIFLLLAGCERQVADDAAPAPSGTPSAELRQTKGEEGSPAADLRRRAEQALTAILTEPATARYSDLRLGAAGALCGRVDDNRGPRPFIVTPEGVGVISMTPDVMFEDPEDVFPDFYIRWCATPEELRGIGPRIASRNLEEVAPDAESTLVMETVPSPPAPAETPPLPPPVSSDEDSFSRAVIRNESKGAGR